MSNIDRDDNSSPIPSDEEFAEQQAALVLRQEQVMWEMQEAEDRLAEQRCKHKEEKERKRKVQEEKEKHERKAKEEKEKRERQERERLEKRKMEEECREEQERVRALEEMRKTDAMRQKVKDAEVHKYLEDLESEALMKGKIFYGVQKILRKSVGKPSGATTQAWGTLPGILGERVTLINSKGQTLTGTRNESRCGQCELGNRVCVAPDNVVSDF
jgi:AAA15 family ATPase/GTPase